MKVKVAYIKCKPQNTDVIDTFIKFLQEEKSLESDVKIFFMGERIGKMTTGSRTDTHELRILASERMLIDILRTLAHEWVHEYEFQILHWSDGPDIGGRNENLSNIEAGIIMKRFQKKYPEFIEDLYAGIEHETDDK